MWKLLAVILIGDLVTVINCQQDTDGDGLSMLYLRLFPSKTQEHKSAGPVHRHDVHLHLSNEQPKYRSKTPISSNMLVSDWDIKRLQDLLTALHVENYKKTLQQNRSQEAPMFVG